MLRSALRIAELQSISQAAKALGFSQPTLSLHIRLIEDAVGGSIFDRTANGSRVTELGEQVLRHARKIIETNDQLLSLRGVSVDRQSVRLGASNSYAGLALKVISSRQLVNATILAAEPTELLKALIDGFIDIALLPVTPSAVLDRSIVILRECEEPLYWVRSRDFTLSPGKPIPLLTRSGNLSDELMLRALESQGIVYRIAVNGADYHCKLEAVRAGMGVTAFPARLIPDDLVRAHEYYLPELQIPRLVLCAKGRQPNQGRELVQELVAGFFGAEDHSLN